MQQTPPNPTTLDDETLALIRKVFQFARSGDAEELAAFLDHGFPPNLRNERGDSLLMLASYHGHLDASKVLLERGADPEVMNDQGQSPLAGAAFKGNVAMATLLLDHGAKVDNAVPGGKTALMFAAMFNRVEIAQLLLARGADPAWTSSDGFDAAAMARKMGAADTAALLGG
jgi:ankyrin repeat protein